MLWACAVLGCPSTEEGTMAEGPLGQDGAGPQLPPAAAGAGSSGSATAAVPSNQALVRLLAAQLADRCDELEPQALANAAWAAAMLGLPDFGFYAQIVQASSEKVREGAWGMGCGCGFLCGCMCARVQVWEWEWVVWPTR